MIELEGKYNQAKIFTDVIEESAVKQIQTLIDQEFTSGSIIRIMPDVHAGAGCTIGTTMTITDKIVPNLVGVDIGCGMLCVQLKEKHVEPQKLDKLIHEKIPAGFDIRKEPHNFFYEYEFEYKLKDLRCYNYINYKRASLSLGTLGGGNHFIEVDRGADKTNYLIVHTGSRHLGLEVANYYQAEAYNKLTTLTSSDLKALVENMKAEGRQEEIQDEIIRLKDTKKIDIPKSLAYADGYLFDNYIHDMKIVQEYAFYNRHAIMDDIIRGMHFHTLDAFTTIHNYIDTDNMILRKGAVSAQKYEKLLIPINMRDGSLICIGKGNEDWNYSAPHGAGRLMSRRQARESFTVSEFKKEMKNVYTTSCNSGTIDECPMAYKSIDDIVDNIGDTVSIQETIKPIYNFKAGDED